MVHELDPVPEGARRGRLFLEMLVGTPRLQRVGGHEKDHGLQERTRPRSTDHHGRLLAFLPDVESHRPVGSPGGAAHRALRSYERRALRGRAAGTSLCGGVTAYFADGTSAEGSVLVGADGIRAVVRSQRAPHAETVEAGILAIYGRVPMATGRAIVSPETLEDICTVATHARKVFLGLGAVRVLTPPDIASAALAPQTELKAQPDYRVSIVGGRHEHFPRDREAMRAASSAELQEIAAGMLAPWPERTGEGRVAQRELRASRRREPPFMPSVHRSSR